MARRSDDVFLDLISENPEVAVEEERRHVIRPNVLYGRLSSVAENFVFRFTPLFTHAGQVRGDIANVLDSNHQHDGSSLQLGALTQSLGNLPFAIGNEFSSRRDILNPRWNNDEYSLFIARRPPDSEEGENRDPLTSPSASASEEGRDVPRDEHEEHLQARTQEILALIQKFVRYIPAMFLICLKFAFDHIIGLAFLCIMNLSFVHVDKLVKTEAAKPSERSWIKLLIGLTLSVTSLFLVGYVAGYAARFSSILILRPVYERSPGLWVMMWVILISDFVIKHITADFKIFLTLLPERILAYKSRAKVYFCVECVSQLYRALVPMHLWFLFLSESYEGYGKIMSFGLIFCYFAFKALEITKKTVILLTSVDRLFKSSDIGSVPTKDQLDAAGSTCPICHEEYTNPVLLDCAHIFCEACALAWLNKIQTCPLCRTPIAMCSIFRNGGTYHYYQIY